MSDDHAKASFSFDESARVVRGTIEFPASLTGEQFTIRVATPVPADKKNHWKVLAKTLHRVGRQVSRVAYGIEGKPKDQTTA